MCANNSKQLLMWLVPVYLTVEIIRLCQEKGDQLWHCWENVESRAVTRKTSVFNKTKNKKNGMF